MFRPLKSQFQKVITIIKRSVGKYMCDGMDINYRTRTRTLCMHTTLYLYLCVQFLHPASCLLELNRNETAHGDAMEGKWRGKMRMEWVASSLASFIGTWSIQHYYWTDSPADLNGLVRFAERPILVSARVPSRSDSAIPVCILSHSEMLALHFYQT